jgi:hypothetical protein
MKKHIKNQGVPLILTGVTCLLLVGLLWLEIKALNTLTADKISTVIRIQDVIIGLTIYLKTSIDFAIFIGRLMEKNNSLRGRIGIEIGTATGNALGTMIILAIWTFFKEVDWLLAIMVFVASLVLLRMAQDGLEHVDAGDDRYPKWFQSLVKVFEKSIISINKISGPIVSKIIPSHAMKIKDNLGLKALLISSFSIPFILGLDDFAGYVPLFKTVNVYGFAIGVFVGHMVLNLLLFISPKKTIQAVKNPIISFIGSIAFFGLAIWGLIEATKIITGSH